jgi:hypothetical protein
MAILIEQIWCFTALKRFCILKLSLENMRICSIVLGLQITLLFLRWHRVGDLTLSSKWYDIICCRLIISIAESITWTYLIRHDICTILRWYRWSTECTLCNLCVSKVSPGANLVGIQGWYLWIDQFQAVTSPHHQCIFLQ